MTQHNWIVLGLLVVCSLSAFGGGYYLGYLRAASYTFRALNTLRLESEMVASLMQQGQGATDDRSSG